MAKEHGVSDGFGEGAAGLNKQSPFRGEDGELEDIVTLLRKPLTDLNLTTAGKGSDLVKDRTSGLSMTAALAAVKATADAGIGAVKRTVTIGHGNLTDADGSQTINIGAVLPANARILSVDMHTFTPFSGGGAGAVTVDVGTSGDADALVDGADLFAAAVDGGPSTMPAGIRPNKLFASAGAQLIATVAADVNVADLDAGAVTIDVLYCVLA